MFIYKEIDMEKRYLCIDVGGGSIKYAVLDKQLTFYEKGSVPTPYEDVPFYLEVLEKLYRKFEDQVCGIAMSVPGIIDSDNGICITGGALKYVELLPLANLMKERCGVPVSIMNDAKCAALAEATWGSLAGCQDAIVLVFGTGIGGAIVKDGEIHMGKHFAAGEFSFILMDQECDIEDNIWARRNGSHRLIRLASLAKGMKPEDITGVDVFRWAEEGDAAALWALDKFTRDIAYVIMNLQIIYDPERFAIGGGISKQPLLLEYILKNLHYYYSIYPCPIPHAEVTTCKYYNDSNLIGALGYYLSRFGLKE